MRWEEEGFPGEQDQRQARRNRRIGEMEEGASTSSFPSRTLLLKRHHTTHPIRKMIPVTIIPIISLEGPEEGEGVMGSLWLMVASSPGPGASPRGRVPDSWSTHLMLLQGVQSMTITFPSGHLGTDTGGPIRDSWLDEEKEGAASRPGSPDKTVEGRQALAVCRGGSPHSPSLGGRTIQDCVLRLPGSY